MSLPFAAAAPLAGFADPVLLVVRLIMGVTMIYYGWPKVRDPKKNAADFEKMGFRPGALWGTLILLVEFGGGIAILLGVYAWVAAALYAVEMLTGSIWKITRAGKPFPDWSYDLLLLALALVLLASGPGAYRLA
jgi:putative oxidoreductase